MELLPVSRTWKRSFKVSKRYVFLILSFSHTSITEAQNVANPITAKLYGGGGPEYTPGPDDEEDPFHSHDEL
jgi:hypothetical protein